MQAVGNRAWWLYLYSCVPVDRGIDLGIAKVLVLFDPSSTTQVESTGRSIIKASASQDVSCREAHLLAGVGETSLYITLPGKAELWSSPPDVYSGRGKTLFIFTCRLSNFQATCHGILGPEQLREPMFHKADDIAVKPHHPHSRFI